MYDFFEQLKSGVDGESEIPSPFFTVDREDPEAIHTWLKHTLAYCEKDSSDRTRLQQSLLLAYKGFYDPYFLDRSDQLRQTDVTLSGKLMDKKPRRLPVNHMRDLVEQSVSRICALPLVPQPFPGTNEVMDKNGALVTKQVLETIDYQCRVKSIRRKVVRDAILFGEGFLMPFWNPNKGPEDKKATEELKKKPVERKNRRGETITTEDGRKVYIEGPVRIGDVDYDKPNPWDIFLDPSTYEHTPQWAMRRRFLHNDFIRAKHPDKQSKIVDGPGVRFYNFNDMDWIGVKAYSVYVEFYHRRTLEMPEGFYACFTLDCLCDYGKSQYPEQGQCEFGDIPLVRLTGFDVAAELRGSPSISDIAALQHAYNQLTTIVRRNIWMGSAPKWMVPKGSVNIQGLINTPGVLEYTGPLAPQLATFPTVGPEVFTFRDSIRQEMEQLSGVYGVSRGDPPPNTRTAEQLAFYEEQQQARAAGPSAKYAEFVIEVYEKTLAIVSEYYDEADGRMRLILGEDREPMLRPYSIKTLSHPWNIRIQAGSSLSTSPTVRMNQLLQIRREFPELLSAEQFADQTQFGQVDKVYDAARAAIMMAESENQDFAEGADVLPPEPYQEQEVHWKTHYKLIQSRAYQEWSDKKKAAFEDHIHAHEFLMWELAEKNPAFMQKLLTLPGYPAFFSMQDQEQAPPAPVVQPPGGEAAVPPGPAPMLEEQQVPLPGQEYANDQAGDILAQ